MAEYDYPVKEFLDSFTRAFRDGVANFILFDGHQARSKFLRQSIEWALQNDLIYEDENTSGRHSDEQWAVQAFRLTKNGKNKILYPRVTTEDSVLDVVIKQWPERKK